MMMLIHEKSSQALSIEGGKAELCHWPLVRFIVVTEGPVKA